MQSTTTPKQTWHDPTLFQRAGVQRRSWMEDVAKRSLDIFVSSILMILLSPFALALAVWIKRELAGTGILPRTAPGERWQDIQHSEVPHNVRATGKLCGTACDGGGRYAGDPGGALAAGFQAERAAATVERVGGGYEPGGTETGRPAARAGMAGGCARRRCSPCDRGSPARLR